MNTEPHAIPAMTPVSTTPTVSAEVPQISRREALQWVMTASATLALMPNSLSAADGAAPVTAKPYGTDPLLNHTYKPGDLWPLTLSGDQRKTVSALCDVVLPADDRSPSASSVGVPDFIDEWISAPYPNQLRDREIVLTGLASLEADSRKRFNGSFAGLEAAQKTTLVDTLASAEKDKAESAKPASFFSTFRDLTMTGFYTTPAGMKDIGFIGNMALTRFPDPPREVLEKLGLV